MTPFDQLVGESPEIESIRQQIRWLVQRGCRARRPLSIRIFGETGTGKTLVARSIHAAGPQADGPFIRVNCAALPEALLDAELFGVEEGEESGAQPVKPGLFRAATGGTILLDGLSQLTPHHQAKILDVLESRTLRRIGGTRDEPVDAWIVAASSRDALAGTPTSYFRDDRYHRPAVVSLRLPPLRQRGLDVLLLAERFMARACADYGAPPKTLAPSARAALLAHAWPGNVRELANVVDRVVLFTEATEVTAEILDATEAPVHGPAARSGLNGPGDARDRAGYPRSSGRWSTLAGLCDAALLGAGRSACR
jgi:transcriptional regulator with PAS, ATPase and Fis domain